MFDERDRLGQKLHDVEAARENQWARQHDAKLIEKMRHKRDETLRCPHCGGHLIAREHIVGHVLICERDHGGWLVPESLTTTQRS